MTLYLIGVDHSVQHDGRTAYESREFPNQEFRRLRINFRAFLVSVAREKRAIVIAEESSEDVLKKFGANQSVAHRVAETMGIEHRFCDPGDMERNRLNIAAGECADPSGTRENFWLEKLNDFKEKHAVFILGADHVQDFSLRATNAGFSVEVVEKYYGRDFFDPLPFSLRRALRLGTTSTC